jgi:hypothetical protein
MTPTDAAVRLLRTYDVDRLCRDLQACERAHEAWVTHAQVLEGKSQGWTVLPLRARGGHTGDACARSPGFEPFLDTALLDHAPYVREILTGLDSTISSVRWSSLHAGGSIYEHSDGDGFELGNGDEIRLHLPVETSDDVWFIVDGVRYPLRGGELWYGNFTRPHSVENRSAHRRVHLLIDTRVSETVLRLFPPAYLEGRTVKADPPRGATPPELKAIAGFSFEVGGGHATLDGPLSQLPPPLRDVLSATFAGRNEVRWIDGRLWAVIRGTPTFQFEIETARRLRVAYQPAAIQLEWAGGALTGASLELSMAGQLLRLPLQVAALS